MKRSEAIQKLLSKVVSPYEIIKQELYDNGVYQSRAERLLNFIEEELGMLPPRSKKKEKYSAKVGQYPDEYTLPVNEWDEE